MTVENTQSTVSYVSDGSRTDFPTTFRFMAHEDLLVELSTDGGVTWVTQSSGLYDVTGAVADEPGGDVIFDVAPVAGIVRITRNTQITQALSFQTSGPLPAKSLELALDKLTLIAQEADRRIAALEAGTTGSTYTAVRVTDTFVVANPSESTWPRNVAAGIAPVTCVIGRIENLSDGSEVLYGPGDLAWAPSGTNVSVKNIAGLTVGDQYRVTFEVRS